MEKPNLLWECITYEPKILFNIEATNGSLRTSLCHDMSHFHYFLESQFGYENIRDSDFAYCKSLLKTEILENDPRLFQIAMNVRNWLKPFIRTFDCYT